MIEALLRPKVVLAIVVAVLVYWLYTTFVSTGVPAWEAAPLAVATLTGGVVLEFIIVWKVP